MTEKSYREYQRVRKIKEKHERDLLGITGVVGVGIGEEAGRNVIVVSISKISPKIPFNVEGVPVRVKYTGVIKAL